MKYLLEVIIYLGFLILASFINSTNNDEDTNNIFIPYLLGNWAAIIIILLERGG